MNKNQKIILFILAMNAFCIGSTEFISVGLLPMVAEDFNISQSLAGLTVSLYAFGVVIGAPLLTIIASRFSRKQALLSTMLIFIIGNLFACLAINYSMLLLGRIIASLAHGLFMSISTVIAAEIVSEDKQAFAISTMFTGLTVATVTGVPLGTALASFGSWRLSFAFLTLLGIISLVLNIIFIPNNLSDAKKIYFHQIPSVLKNREIILSLLTTALGYGATFTVYTYVSPMLSNVGFSTQTIVVILIVYGIMVAIGNSLGGKIANTNTKKHLKYFFICQLVVMCLIYFTVNSHIGLLISIILLGLVAFLNVPPLQLMAIKQGNRYASEAAEVVAALNISAFNVGISLGSLLASMIITKFSFSSLAIAGIVMVIMALFTLKIQKYED